MCIFEKKIKDKMENECFIKQLQELILHFSKLKSNNKRNYAIEILRQIEEAENMVRN